MKINEFLEKKAEKIPGLGYVATAISLAATVFLRKEGADSQIWLIAFVWICAVFFYLLGAVLDPVFYDPWFSLPPNASEGVRFAWYEIMKKVRVYSAILNKTRSEAARKLNDAVGTTDRNRESGIYQTAKKLFEKSDAWDDRVKCWLETSKASRAFVIPFVIIAGCDIVRRLFFPAAMIQASSWKLLLSWPTASLIALGTFMLYLWLRVIHAINLFQLVLEHDIVILSAKCFEGEHGGVVQTRNLISTGVLCSALIKRHSS